MCDRHNLIDHRISHYKRNEIIGTLIEKHTQQISLFVRYSE